MCPQTIREAYGEDKSDDYIEREFVAIRTQQMLGNQEFLDRLVVANESLAYRMLEELQYMSKFDSQYESMAQALIKAFETRNEELKLNNGMQYSLIDYSNHDLARAREKSEIELATAENNRLYYVKDGDLNYYSFKDGNGKIYLKEIYKNGKTRLHNRFRELYRPIDDETWNKIGIGSGYSKAFDGEGRLAKTISGLSRGEISRLWNGDRKGSHGQSWRNPLYVIYSKRLLNGIDIFNINGNDYYEYDLIDYFPESVANEILSSKGGTKHILSFDVDKYGKGNIVLENGKNKQFYLSSDEENLSYSHGISLEEKEKSNDIYNELESYKIPFEIDTNDNMIVYHRTSQNAKNEILKTGIMKAKEDGLFFSTKENGQNNYGYGDAVVKLRIPTYMLEIDDLFSGDEASMKLPTGSNREINVSQYLDNKKYSQGVQLTVAQEYGIPTPDSMAKEDEIIKTFENKIVDPTNRSVKALQYLNEQNDISLLTRNRIERNINAWTQGFDTLDEYKEFKNKVSSFDNVQKIEEERNSIKQDIVDAFDTHNQDYYRNAQLLASSKERMLAEKERQINATDMSNFDKTLFDSKPLTNEQVLMLNKLNDIQYKYVGDNLINIYATEKSGDILDTGAYTKEQIANKFGTEIANEIISNVDANKKVYNYEGKTNESIYDDEEFVKKAVKEAEKNHGITTDTREVGYIDLNGKMLDFSGKKDGAGPGFRNYDHRDLSTLDGVAWYDFVKMGNIRMFPESGGFELEVKPNAKQQKALINFLQNNPTAINEGSFIGISKSIGNNNIGRNEVANLVYENGESPQQIMNDVMGYFNDRIRYSQGIELDNDGNKINNNMSNYLSSSVGDRVDPTDINSPHMEWLHGTPNATFTEFDNSKENTTSDTYVNNSKATYLVSGLEGAKSYSATDKIVDPYNLQEKPTTVDDFNKEAAKNGIEIVKVKNNNNGYDWVAIGDTIEDHVKADRSDPFDIEIDVYDYYLDENTGEVYDTLAAYQKYGDDMDNVLKEVKGYDLGLQYEDTINNNEQVVKTAIKDLDIYSGNYKVYAKSENPLIIDANGKAWNDLITPQDQARINALSDDDIRELNNLGLDEYSYVKRTTRDFEEYALDNGYDSIRYMNLVDYGAYNYEYDDEGNPKSYDVLVVFDSSQVKDINNQNPTNNKDIRYSQGIKLGEPKSNYKRVQEKIDEQEKQTALDMLGFDEKFFKEIDAQNNDPLNIKSSNETIDQLADSITKPQKKVTLEDVKNQETKVLETKKYKKETVSIKEQANNLIQKFADNGKPIWDLSRKSKNDKLYPAYDAYVGSGSMAEYMLTKKKGGLYSILSKIPKDQRNDFDNMVYHGVNIDAAKLGKNVFRDFTSEQSQEIVNQYLVAHPEWKEVWDEVLNYEKELRQMLVDSGRITKDTMDKWEQMYPHFVHVVRDIENNQKEIEPDNKLKSANQGTVKERTGGNSNIKSLHDALTKQTEQVFNSITLNALAKEYSTSANVKSENWGKQYDNLDFLGDELKAADKNTPATLVYYVDGETKIMEIPDSVYKALDKTPLVKDNVLTEKLAAISNVRRNLITGWSLTFPVRNIIKDPQDVLFKSEHPLSTYINFPRAIMGLALTEDSKLTNLSPKMKALYELAEGYRKLGGAKNTITTVNDFGSKYNNTVGRVERLNAFGESVPRFAEYMASLKKGRTPTQAMYDANKVTTNFKMGGKYTKAADRYGFTFLNASVEGLTEFVRTYEEAYDKKGVKGILGKMAISTLLMNVPLMIVNSLRWKDDKDYEELSDYIKENYYVVAKTKDGRFIRIPKGRIAAAYQKVLQTVYDNGKTLVSNDTTTEKAKKMWEDSLESIAYVWENIGVNNPMSNNILSPIINVATNKTWYGEDLLSEYDLRKDPSEQYDYNTDKFSKWVGQNLNISPTKINYLLDQYSGGIGDVVLPYLTPKAETDLNNPVVSTIVDQFTSDPVFKNQNISDFFTLEEDMAKAASKQSATDEQKLASKFMTTIKYQMFKLYGDRADIYNDGSLSDEQKYKKASEIQEQINDLARTANDTYDNIDMSNGYGEIDGIGFFKDSDGTWAKVEAETLDEMNSLGMTTEQKNEYFNIKEEITGTNKVNSLLNLYEQKKEIENSSYSQNLKNKKLKDINEKIAKKEEKFTSLELSQIKSKGSIDARELNYDAIINSKLNDEQKNYLYDNYYSTKTGEYINDLEVDDATKLDLKHTVANAEGMKDENNKTISNSKALEVADAYADAGVLDDVFKYIKENNMNPSEFGLSKTVYNYTYSQMAAKYKEIFGQDFGGGDNDTNVIDNLTYQTEEEKAKSSKSAYEKYKKAMLSYAKSLGGSGTNYYSSVNNVLKNATTVDEAKKKVEEILNRIK